MSQIVFVHWNCAEAEARAERLRDAGHVVACHCDPKANPRVLLASPPDAFVIDLARLPSQGRELGGFLRRAPATRHVPLVFVEGDPAKTESVRALLPDAFFTAWACAPADVARAVAAPPLEPVVPGAMAAYAGAPLTKKLGIKPSSALLLIGAPTGFERTLASLPSSVHVTRSAPATADVVLWFATDLEDLDSRYERVAACVHEGGRLWILWRKRPAAGLTQRKVQAAGLSRGWVDYKISSIDDAWSGLCFARRKPTGKERT